MNKKLLGAALMTGAAVTAVVATRNMWAPLVKAGIQEVLIWTLDDQDEDDERESEEVAAFNAKGEKTGDSSVIELSCGTSIIKTVGFTTIYVSDSAQGALFADSQKFYKIRVDNNDRGVPMVNFAWRTVKNNFVGTAAVAQVCDQWNNPIMAFAGTINGFSTDVVKSTMFQVKYQNRTGYVWISRGSYTVTDAALLG